jgi:hypothetical protein
MNIGEQSAARWIDFLDDEDMAFLKRFLLCSGSLKDLAEAYRVSYPTVRLRLDRLIEKIKILEAHRAEDEFERLLRMEYASGRLEGGAFRKLLATYQKRKEKSDE